MMPLDVKPSTYTDFNVGNNNKDLEFDVRYHAKNWSHVVTLQIVLKIFVLLKKLKILFCGHM